MEQDNQPKDKEMTQRISTISAIMGIIMTAIYMGMSFLLLFTNLFVGKVPEWVRYMMGVVLLVYGIYRGYRVYKSK